MKPPVPKNAEKNVIKLNDVIISVSVNTERNASCFNEC